MTAERYKFISEPHPNIRVGACFAGLTPHYSYEIVEHNQETGKGVVEARKQAASWSELPLCLVDIMEGKTEPDKGFWLGVETIKSKRGINNV